MEHFLELIIFCEAAAGGPPGARGLQGPPGVCRGLQQPPGPRLQEPSGASKGLQPPRVSRFSTWKRWEAPGAGGFWRLLPGGPVGPWRPLEGSGGPRGHAKRFFEEFHYSAGNQGVQGLPENFRASGASGALQGPPELKPKS